MDDKDMPIYFTRAREFDAAYRYAAVGAVVGALAGIAMFLNQGRIVTNALNHVNRGVVENYHPDLLK